jgi:asparagine synthase (glutamine-hydrolysing)
MHSARVTPMLDSIPHRGQDAVRVCCSGNVGFGNRLLWTTPESISEILPRCSPSGVHMIAADARIDNRDDLIQALGIAKRPDTIVDSELILRAYEKWGESCADRLIGDFSFAVWDRREQQLFCARDSAGIKSFYYYSPPELFAFASEIKALTALPALPCVLNEQRVEEFLDCRFEDRTSTFYAGISRLPPASSLLVTRSSLRIRRYWRPDPQREIRLRGDREYAEAFREKFDDAVRCRLRNAFPTGSTLSGGLDSSAVACTAQKILGEDHASSRVHTFSIIFPGLPEQDLRVIDERRYIECVLRSGSFEPHYIHGDRLHPLENWRQVHHHLDEANFAPNLYLHWAMYREAQKAGVRVFLDGLDGDTTVSHGFEYLQELARRFRWVELHRQASLLAQNLFGGSTARRIIWKYCLREMVPDWMHRAWSTARGNGAKNSAEPALTHPQLMKRFSQRRRAAEYSNRRRARTARQHHARVLDLPLYGHMLEAADNAAAAFGIEARYPFFDRRLIEFCLALPPGQKLSGGWNRAVFRRAMEGVLPPEIQWRSSKGDLSPNFRRRLLENNVDVFNGIVAREDGIFGNYVDVNAMRDAIRQCRATAEPARSRNMIGLFTAANLALWLEQTRLKPAGKHS